VSVVIGVDFDGTLAEHEFPDIGLPVPGAFEWLKKFQAAGAKLMLWTMRSDGRVADGSPENGPVLTEAVEFCRKHGVEFWAVNENPEQRSWTGSNKQYAHAYIDDAAVGCPLRPSRRAGGRPMVDWDVVGPMVMELLAAKKV
jgi:hypothetical protein